jgi:hypothetical protein
MSTIARFVAGTLDASANAFAVGKTLLITTKTSRAAGGTVRTVRQHTRLVGGITHPVFRQWNAAC